MKVTKVVNHDQVEYLTREGWQLVFTHGNAQRIAVEPVKTREAGYHGGPSWEPERYENTVATIVDPLFVLEKDTDVASREAELQEQLYAERETVGRQELMIRELQGKVFTAEQNEACNERRVKEYAEANASLREKNFDASDKMRKLEADLAKVRKEIGEARWREVLGQ